MKKNKIKRIVFLMLSIFFSFCIGIGFWWTPKKLRLTEPKDTDVLDVMQVNHATPTHSINVSDDGLVSLDGEDCYFDIENITTPGQTVVLRFAEPIPYKIQFITAVKYNDGLSDWDNNKRWIYSYGEKYAECVCISLPQDGGLDYSVLRIRPSGNVKISAIEIHSGEPEVVYKSIPRPAKNIFAGIVMGCLLSFFCMLIERRCSLENRISEWLARNRKVLFEDAIVVLVAIGMAVLLNCILSGGEYSFAFHAVIVSLVVSIFVLIRNHVIRNVPVEQTFFALILITGICMTLCCWPEVSWDAYEHYNSTLQSTRLHGDIPTTDANNLFGSMGEIPEKHYTSVISYINRRNDGISGWIVNDFSLTRIPGAVPMVLVNLFGGSAYASFVAGRLGQLAVYALCGYFGMKRLHSGKMIFAVIFSFPVNIFLATNYSDDYIVTGFVMLGMAYFVGMCQEKTEKIRYKDVIVMLLAFVVGCMPKQIYVPILIFPFLMPKEKIKNKKIYYSLCTMAILVTLVSFAEASYGNMTSGGDQRAGLGNVDPAQQMANIFVHPIWYAGVLIRYLIQWWNPIQNPTGTFFAYLGEGTGYLFLIILLVVVTLTDKNGYDEKTYSVWVRAYSVLHYVGMSALIVTALYLVFSPVKSTYMAGAQPRYMIPMIYPLCSVVTGRGVILDRVPYKWYNFFIFVAVFAINYTNVIQLMLPRTLF